MSHCFFAPVVYEDHFFAQDSDLPYRSLPPCISSSCTVAARLVARLALIHNQHTWLVDKGSNFRLILGKLWLKEKLGEEHCLFKSTKAALPSLVYSTTLTRIIGRDVLWLGVGLCGVGFRSLFRLFEHLDQVFGQGSTQ